MPPHASVLISAAEADTATARLQKFWRAGRASWRRVDPERPGLAADAAYRHGHKCEVLKNEAGRLRLNPDTMRKCWTVSRAFTAEQIDDLARLIRRHLSRFGPSHLVRLLAVRSPGRRLQLARQAIRRRLGVAALGRLVQAENGGRRPRVGRPPGVPADDRQVLLALDALGDKWERWCAAVGGRLPDRMRAAVVRATRATQEVRRQVALLISTPGAEPD